MSLRDLIIQTSYHKGRNETIVTFDTLRPHQVHAFESWLANDRRGILAYATGSGKTFIGLVAIRDALQRGEACILLVPSVDLMLQWKEEIERGLKDLQPRVLSCGGGHDEWKSKNLLRIWTRSEGNKVPRIVLSSIQTAASQEFLETLSQGDHLLLVIDEVHRSGSREASQVLALNSGPRLGLSATPTRAGDEEGTTKILEYFDGLLPCTFSLKDGIRDGILTPYFYYPRTVALSAEEQEEWLTISSRIGRLLAGSRSYREDGEIPDQVRLLAIQRARIAKTSSGKPGACLEVFRLHYEEGQRWIVYCDSAEQAGSVTRALNHEGFPSQEYHTQMAGHRQQTLRRFDIHGGILVAIRCLDEGVNIPLATHGVILASSRNNREFIQRRGRLLRKAPGKFFAHIFDTLVVPQVSNDEEHRLHSLLLAELTRAYHFGLDATNPDCVSKLAILALRYGIDTRLISDLGYEHEQ